MGVIVNEKQTGRTHIVLVSQDCCARSGNSGAGPSRCGASNSSPAALSRTSYCCRARCRCDGPFSWDRSQDSGPARGKPAVAASQPPRCSSEPRKTNKLQIIYAGIIY
jgi:hypothetical protein